MAAKHVAFVEKTTGNVVSTLRYDDSQTDNLPIAPADQTVIDIPAGVDPAGKRWSGSGFVQRDVTKPMPW